MRNLFIDADGEIGAAGDKRQILGQGITEDRGSVKEFPVPEYSGNAETPGLLNQRGILA